MGLLTILKKNPKKNQDFVKRKYFRCFITINRDGWEKLLIALNPKTILNASLMLPYGY